MQIQPFFDPDTATVSYVVADPASRHCAIIDPVLDYDPAGGKITTTSADKIAAFIVGQKLTVAWILETHIHADHLTAAAYLKRKFGGKVGIGAGIIKVLQHWVKVLNAAGLPLDGSQFDRLFNDGEEFKIGDLTVKVMVTPGHTPDSISYLIGDALFAGDSIFMPYVGTARTDFPGGSAAELYRSISRIFALPETTRIFTCHDYPPTGQAPAWESTVASQKRENILVKHGADEAAFVALRTQRDTGKTAPRLLYPAIQFNLRGGRLPPPDTNGTSYMKIPIAGIPEIT